MKKTVSIRVAWYGLITFLVILPVLTIFPFIWAKAHSILLKNALLAKYQYTHKLESAMRSELERLLTLLENKSDPIAYTLQKDRDKELLETLLKVIILREKAVQTLLIVSPEGKILTGADRHSALQGNMLKSQILRASMPKTFDDDIAKITTPVKWKNFIGTTFRHNGLTGFYISVPIDSKNSPSNILLAVIDVRKFWNKIKPAVPTDNTTTYLIDSNGVLLASPDSSIFKKGDSLTDLKIVSKFVSGEKFLDSETYTGLSGEPVFGIVLKATYLGWGIVSEVEESLLMAPIRNLLLGVTVICLLVVIIIGWAGFWFTRKMLSSITVLSDSFHRASIGDYSRTGTVSSVTEINQLVTGFNNMVEYIQERERELSRSEQKIKAIITSVGEGIISINAAGVITFVNHELCKIFGYKEDELLRQNVEILMPKNFREAHGRAMNRHLKTGKTNILGKKLELEGLHKDGTSFPIEIKIEKTFIESGSFFFTAAIENISKRKKAEETVEKSKNSLMKAQQIASLGSWDWNIEKSSLAWSDEVYRIFGLEPQKLEATYEAFRSFIHFDDRDKVTQAIEEALNKKEDYSIEHRIVLKDGTEKIVHEQGEVTFNDSGVPVMMFGTVQDITGRKAAEKELRRLSTAIEQSAETIVITDKEGIVEYVNPAFEKLTGYSGEEALGNTPNILKSGKHDNAFYEELWQTIKAGKVWTGNFFNKKKDGTLFEESATISPVFGSDGEIVNFVAAKRDITREWMLQKAREYFTIVTSHELNTPLTHLQLVKTLLRGFAQKYADDKELGDITIAMEKSYDELSKIVETTAMLAMLSSPQKEQSFSTVYLRMETDAVIDKIRSAVEEEKRDVAIMSDIESIPIGVEIRGKQDMVSEAIKNILSNAVKYTPDKGRVFINGYCENENAVIMIEDEGIGIPEEKSDDVFEPYYSLENVALHSTGKYKFKGGGMGLGLTISKMIVDYHGGGISILSREGAGTRVTITFPLKKKTG